MATVNIFPNADVANSPAWTISSGSDVWAMLDDDDSGNVSSDSSDIYATAFGKVCVVSMQDLLSGLSGATINSVTGVVKHNNNTRGQTYEIAMKIGHSGGLYYSEGTGTVSAALSWQTTTFTERTTSDGSSAWTFAEINGLVMHLSLNAHSGGTTGITYAYFIIDYTEAAAAEDNAVFFGTNF